jgi:hypothetical protein
VEPISTTTKNVGFFDIFVPWEEIRKNENFSAGI